MEREVTERRRDARFAPPADVTPRATLRPGCVVSLVDVSAGGALVEAPRPLRPGARVHLLVASTTRTVAVAAHVTRCLVWSLDPIDGVTYRGALKFEQRIEWQWGEPTRRGHDLPESDRLNTERSGNHLPASRHAAADAKRKHA